MREPQRFPLGTRVADPLEGRTGDIQAYDADSGLYSLVYSDGHRDELPASEAEKLVIRQTPTQQTQETGADPNQFLGATVTKSSTSYEGKTLTSSGQVTQYFADIRRFRVLFPDGLYSDMTLEEVKQNVQGAEKSAEDAAQPPAKKKSKHHHREEEERPLNTQKFESRKTAYTICREVLGIILSQKKVGKLCTEKQKLVLSNKDLQVRKVSVWRRSYGEVMVVIGSCSRSERWKLLWRRTDCTRWRRS